MITAGFKLIGDDVVIQKFYAGAATLAPAVNGVTRTFTQLLVTSVQAHASGRPGPNAPTGQYRRSWGAEFHAGVGGFIEGEASTNAPQANRLENGFNGVDSIGRHYNQPPYPHVEPAVQSVTPGYVAALGAVVEAIA